jgi:hypothetical protein
MRGGDRMGAQGAGKPLMKTDSMGLIDVVERWGTSSRRVA